MSAEVMAFVTRGQLPYAIKTMDWDVVSTVAYFSLEVTRDGTIDRDNGGWLGWNGRRMDLLIEKAHEHGSKVVLSLERFAWSAGQTAIARRVLASRDRRLRLAQDVAQEVARRGVDGVNVDFEPIPGGQSGEFTNFMRLLRRELDRVAPGSQLTFCVTGHHESWDVDAATGPDAADAVYLMGYHYAGTWSRRAGSTAPMGGPQHDVVDSVRSLLRHVEPHELIVGLPYYGHAWPTRGDGLNARTEGGGFDVTLDRAMALAGTNDVRYDKTQQVAWFPYRARPCAGCPARWYQLYFDNPRATEYKLDWLRRQELLGTGVWTIGFEGAPGPHNEAMRKVLLGD
jgi:spore germination protein YaaH